MGAAIPCQVALYAVTLTIRRPLIWVNVCDWYARHAAYSVRIEGAKGFKSRSASPRFAQFTGLRSDRQMMQPCLGPDRLRLEANLPGLALPACGMSGTLQVKNRFCARICARDAAGRAETGETQYTREDFRSQVCRGQRYDGRRPETGETGVVVLITQRSQVQILPRYQLRSSEASSGSGRGLLAKPCAREIAHKPFRHSPGMVVTGHLATI